MIAGVPAIVERAASVATADHTGIVAFRIEQTSSIDAGPIHRRTRAVVAAAYHDERLLHIRVITLDENGTEASSERRAQLERELSASHDGFAVPFDAKHFAEYTYAQESPETVRFTARVEDNRHGDGTFTLDRDGHVTALTYVPRRLPQYATSGTIEETRGRVLPHFWATIRTVQQYEGHRLMLHGTAHVLTTESAFTTFQTDAAASAFVDHAAP